MIFPDVFIYISLMFTRNNNSGKYRRVLWLGFIVYSLLSANYVLAGTAINHPDGRLGRIGGLFKADYASESAELGVNVSDITRLATEIVFPISKTLTFGGAYGLEKNDSLFHNISISIKKYMANPIKSNIRCNPDGAVGTPIINIGGAIRLADTNPEDPIYRLNIEILLPFSEHLTIGTGSLICSEDKPEHTDEYFGIINFFPIKYPKGNIYSNPDGVEGTPSFSFRAGGSEFGLFGRLDIIVPLNPLMSLGVFVAGEKYDFQEVTKATLGIRIHFYSGE